jgi:hypothetical protein
MEGTAAAACEAQGRSGRGRGPQLQAQQRVGGSSHRPPSPCGSLLSCWHTSGDRSKQPRRPCPQPTTARPATRCAAARCHEPPPDRASRARPLRLLLRQQRPPGHGLCSSDAWRAGWLAAAVAWAAARRLLAAPRRWRWCRAAGVAQELRRARHTLPLLADDPSLSVALICASEGVGSAARTEGNEKPTGGDQTYSLQRKLRSFYLKSLMMQWFAALVKAQAHSRLQQLKARLGTLSNA